MTRNDILALLIAWAAQHDAIESVYDVLEQSVGITPESPLSEALWGTFDRYSVALETSILGNADSGWLGYFDMECDMGAKPHPVQDGAATYVLNGIEALADVLYAFRIAECADTKTARESAP
jgi:hypothetical protein